MENYTNTGWIKLHRRFLEWEWFDEPNVMKIFIYLLLAANSKPKRWKGMVINRGQLVTSQRKLADYTQLTRMQVRIAINKLIKTGEIIVNATHNFCIITICNYKSYQDDDGVAQPTDNHLNNQRTAQPITNGSASEKPTDNTQLTTTKEINNNNISTTPARACTCVSVEELVAWLKYKSGGIWKETAMMQLGVKSRGALELMFEDFQRECIAQGVTEKEERDIQPHFMAQMRIRQRKEKENAKIERNNGRGDSRPSKEERDAEFVTYINGLMGGGSQGNVEVGGEPDGDIKSQPPERNGSAR